MATILDEISKNPLYERVLCMEARGVEPLSEGNATKVSTGVVTVLMSVKQTPRNRLSLNPA